MNNCRPILLIEDDENDIFFFRRGFARANIGVPLRVARDGHEALDYLAATGKFNDRAAYPFPCLVVLDLNLPGKPGLEVLKWIRRAPHCRGLPVVVLTSSNSDLDVLVAYRLGANSYTVKPTDPDQLCDWLKVLREYWFEYSVSPAGNVEDA